MVFSDIVFEHHTLIALFSLAICATSFNLCAVENNAKAAIETIAGTNDIKGMIEK